MKIQKIRIQNITFTYSSYDEALKNSILRIGCSFPVKVVQCQNGYRCFDGHKRLSILLDALTAADTAKSCEVPCIVVDQMRTDAGWSRMRHH